MPPVTSSWPFALRSSVGLSTLFSLSVKRLRELCTAHGLEAVGTKEQLKAKLRGKGKQAVGGAVAKR